MLINKDKLILWRTFAVFVEESDSAVTTKQSQSFTLFQVFLQPFLRFFH